MDLIAKLPKIVAHIHNNVHRNRNCGVVTEAEADKDFPYNFAKSLGYAETKDFVEWMRLYLTNHAIDHEGVSAHT